MKKAFTLIELAIVLTIVGLVVGGGFKLLKMQRYKEEIKIAKEDIIVAKNAIIGNTIINGNTLPDSDYFKKNLSPAQGTKGDLLYIFEPTLTTEDICTFTKTDLKVINPENNTIENVAFVVVSESVNRNMQTAYNETNSSVKLYSPSEKVDDNTSPINLKEEYDDVALWITLSELQKEIDCSSNKLTIVNNYALPRDGNCSGDKCYLGSNSVSLIADKGYPYDDDSDVNGLGDSDGDSDPDYLWCIESDGIFNDHFDVSCAGSSIVRDLPGNDCNDTTTYHQCSSPVLDSKEKPGPPDGNVSAGSYSFKLYVKDKTKKINKTLSITIDSR